MFFCLLVIIIIWYGMILVRWSGGFRIYIYIFNEKIGNEFKCFVKWISIDCYDFLFCFVSVVFNIKVNIIVMGKI